MRPNDDTIYQPSERQDRMEEVVENKREKNNGWQKVVIGGVTGIFMGAASMYAANAYGQESKSEDEEQTGQNHTTENGLHVAEVDQSLPFGEAFAQARETVGPGGVFHWHGGIYNTYTESEWNNMTPSERSEFAHQVSPEIQPGEGDTNHYTAHNQGDSQHHEQHDDNMHNTNHQENHDQHGHARQTVNDDHHEVEPEVHVLGVERMQTDDGSYINVGRARIQDEDVALVDLDDDMVFDVRVADLNHNKVIDEGEVVDISDAQITVTDFAAAAMQQGNSIEDSDQLAQAQVQQEDLAPDMPDYMNDADVSTV